MRKTRCGVSVLKGSAFVCLCCFMLAGCRTTDETVKAEAPTTGQVSEQLERLKADNRKLNELLQAYENSRKVADPLAELQQQIPELQLFRSPREWTKITLVAGDKRVPITEPELLKATAPLFIVKAVSRDLNNGPPNDIDPFSVELSNEQGNYTMDIVSRHIAGLPVLSREYFEVDADIAGLGKALLPRPAYLPVESRTNRMLNSGMMEVKEDGYDFYFLSESRIRNVSLPFLTGKKQKVSRPKHVPADLMEDITYYLYGEKVFMKVYSKYIQIRDGEGEAWYQVDPEVSGQMHSQISAG